MITEFVRHTRAQQMQRLLVLFACIGLSSCAVIDKLEALDDNDGYTLPVVEDEANAATVKVRSNTSPSDQQFLHLLIVDGETIMKLAESDRRQFQLDPGTYQIDVTCHTVPNSNYSSAPANLRVADGRAQLELTVEAGDKTCLRISKPLFTCAGVEQAALTVCQ